jgi:hypothetical protein
MNNVQKYNILYSKAQNICSKIQSCFTSNIYQIAKELILISKEIDMIKMKEENTYINELIDDSRVNEILSNIINENDILLLCSNKKILREMYKFLLYDIMNYIGGYKHNESRQNIDENIIELVSLTEFLFNKKSNMSVNGCLIYKINKNFLYQINTAICLCAKPNKFYFDINKLTKNIMLIEKFRELQFT